MKCFSIFRLVGPSYSTVIISKQYLCFRQVLYGTVLERSGTPDCTAIEGCYCRTPDGAVNHGELLMVPWSIVGLQMVRSCTVRLLMVLLSGLVGRQMMLSGVRCCGQGGCCLSPRDSKLLTMGHQMQEGSIFSTNCWQHLKTNTQTNKKTR